MKRNILSSTVLSLVCTLSCSALVHGCGGWDEEEPETLPYYLDALPGKSFGQIYLETAPATVRRPAVDLKGAIQEIASSLESQERSKLIATVDDLLVTARQNYENGDWCNVLHDVRDLLASEATNTEASEYLSWRLDHLSLFGFAKRKETRPWSEKKKETAGSPEAVDLEARANAASAALKPHWLYLRGALSFSAEESAASRQWFDRVVTEFPKSSRAEIAFFMSARCAYYWMRQKVADFSNKNEFGTAREEARKLFETYLATYPDGRFVVDAYGWLGDLVEGDVERLELFIRQVEAKEHPEVRKAALFMCERLLSSAQADDEAVFALAAAHPVIAMGLTYEILNTRYPGDSDGVGWGGEIERQAATRDDSVRRKKWRSEILPRIAAQVAKQKTLYRSDVWEPRSLAILAQAASAAGNQEEALKLTEGVAAQTSDDLLLARAVALQRAGRAEEAIAVYRQLREAFPSSPLADGARLKMALALQDAHHAGLAIVEMRAMLPERKAKEEADSIRVGGQVYPPGDAALDFTDSVRTRDISGAESIQIWSLLETLYEFAPRKELEEVLTAPLVEESVLLEARQILSQRAMADEDLSAAKKMMGEESFNRIAGEVEKLTVAVAHADDAASKSKAMLALGDAWAAGRGKLISAGSSSHREKADSFADTRGRGTLAVRANGLALGMAGVDELLESRDELRHAARWWKAAADAAPAAPLGAVALWKTLDAMPQIAAASAFASVRAIETDQAAASRKVYERLREQFPDTIEAKQYAVYWTFPPLDQSSGDFSDGVYPENEGGRDDYIAGYLHQRMCSYGGIAVPSYDSREWQILWEEIMKLPTNAKSLSIGDFTIKVEALRDQVRLFNAVNSMNLLDDLALFLKEPAVTPEMLSTYLNLRMMILLRSTRSHDFVFSGAHLGGDHKDEEDPDRVASDAIQAAAAQPEMKSVADYLDFLDMAIVANHVVSFTVANAIESNDPKDDSIEFSSRDYKGLERMARAFIAKYPKSPKREAAMLLLARSVFVPSRPHYCKVGTGVLDGLQEPFKPARVIAPLDAYDRAYPNGRYAAQIRLYRAYTAWRMHDFDKAIDLALFQLADNSQQDARTEAGLLMSNIFADLADARYRAELIKVIQSKPEAIKRLGEYLSSKSPHHPLRFLRDYLCDQTGCTMALDEADGSSNAAE